MSLKRSTLTRVWKQRCKDAVFAPRSLFSSSPSSLHPPFPPFLSSRLQLFTEQPLGAHQVLRCCESPHSLLCWLSRSPSPPESGFLLISSPALHTAKRCMTQSVLLRCFFTPGLCWSPPPQSDLSPTSLDKWYLGKDLCLMKSHCKVPSLWLHARIWLTGKWMVFKFRPNSHLVTS